MNMESEELQFLSNTPSQTLHGAKRPRRSLQSSAPLTVPESASPSPLPSSQLQLTPEVINHINGLKHLDDQQIFHLLEAARNRDRSSFSTLGSRSSFLSLPSSRVQSVFSDPRSSIASTDTTFSSYSSASRLSQVSRLSQSISAPSSTKNFACTFCDKPLKSKPYWKSHEEEFHEQRKTWRCPDCEQIFNAGKRFREHHFKLHGCEDCKQPKENGQANTRKPSPCVKKVERVMHHKNAWGCGHCARLLTTWEERCDHVSQHFEDGAVKWDFTNVMLGLLQQPDIADPWKAFVVQRHGDDPQKWPRFTWDAKRCHRLRYSLETQWDTRVFDVQKLVQETYELAVHEPKIEVVDPTEMVTDEPVCLPSETTMSVTMDIDSLEPPQAFEQTEWMMADPVPKETTSNNALSNYQFGANHFTQPLGSTFHHQQTWSEQSFLPNSELVTFQQPEDYTGYTSNIGNTMPHFNNGMSYNRSASSPYLQNSPNPSSQKWVPRLVSIPSRRASSQSQPPPPPPKDNNRPMSQAGVRRRPDNPSRHQTIVHQWTDESSWG